VSWRKLVSEPKDSIGWLLPDVIGLEAKDKIPTKAPAFRPEMVPYKGDRVATANADPAGNNAQTEGTLSVTDNRTGEQYEIPISQGAIKSSDLLQIRTAPDQPGLSTYDPGFVNTASCKSSVTYIDGEKGILEYRGYPI